MAKIGYSLNELYEYSLKEILFILKYRREGIAYEIWRTGTMTRAAQGKSFPTKCEEAIPELFEKQPGVRVQDLPPELQDMFSHNLEEQVNGKFKPR